MTDVPTDLIFVDPRTVETTYRICLAGEPGDGKTIAAASAPDPMLVLNADRPSAWEVARRRFPGKDIRETRYLDASSLDDVFRYLGKPEAEDIATLVIDPWSNIYDQLAATAPKVADSKTGELKPNYELVNSKLLAFLRALRRFDVHVVIVTHLKENETGKKADGKTYARFGGMGLIRKAMAEMDVVALIQRSTPEGGEPVWYAQVQPDDTWAGKDGTDSLGPRRIADLTRWIELARAANVITAEGDDLPWAVVPTTPIDPPPTDQSSTGSGDHDLGQPAGSSVDAAPSGEPSDGRGDRGDHDTVADASSEGPLEELPPGKAPIDAALAAGEAIASDGKLDTLRMAALLEEDDWKLLDLLIEGHTAATAAEQLDLTPEAVRAHVNDIKKLLGQTAIGPIVAMAKQMQTEVPS